MKTKLTSYSLVDGIIWILTVCLLSGFIVLEMFSWGKYLFLFVSLLIFVIDNIVYTKSYLAFGSFQIMFGCFIIYGFLSSLWAISSTNALEFSTTLLLIYVCLMLIAPHYMRKNDVSHLLSVIIWASFVVSIYALYFYGVDALFAASQTQYLRLGNDFSNINTIAMFSAFGVVLQFEKWLYHKKLTLSLAFTALSVFIIAATQSRKGIILMVTGILMILIMQNYSKRKFFSSLFKVVLGASLLGVVVLILFKLSMFSGLEERLQQLFHGFLGTGDLDSGSVKRQFMAQLGLAIWKQFPILGVGLNCTRIVVMEHLGFDAYMHSNFIELLCGLGLLGFILYYSMYAYIFFQLVKYRSSSKRYFIIGIVWLLTSLLMELGTVSYYSKVHCFYLLVQFINVTKLKYRTLEG